MEEQLKELEEIASNMEVISILGKSECQIDHKFALDVVCKAMKKYRDNIDKIIEMLRRYE